MRPLVLLALLALVGCNKPPERTPSPASGPSRKSTAATLVDGFTGRTAVNSGKKAMSTIRRVSEQERGDLEQVMR